MGVVRGVDEAALASIVFSYGIKLERVQNRFTRMLPELEGLSSRERLGRLELYSLDRWRLVGNVITRNHKGAKFRGEHRIFFPVEGNQGPEDTSFG